MSKVKTQSINPRTLTGTLTIGNEGSTTSFHNLSTVVLPGYVTREELDEVVDALKKELTAETWHRWKDGHQSINESE